LAAIDDLISQVEDKALRKRLREEADRLTKEKKFGLVFEEHLPELTPIYDAPIKRGSEVARRDQTLTETWRVLSVLEGKALCHNPATGGQQPIPVSELVVVRRFGEPIYPALTPLDAVQNGPEDAPWHTLIEADNYHALQLLTYLYAGQVDCIYIDPPYNTGARDWKYNNDYVDSNDRWRHSKWLAFMKRRLLIAKRLLNPNDSVLIVTIDENEVLHLGILLDQIFPECKIQMTTIVINPKGTARYNEFSRVEEYAFFVFVGNIRIQPIGSDLLTSRDYSSETHVRWRGLARTGRKGLRSNNPGSWYPIFLNEDDFSVHSIGDAIDVDESESDIDIPEGTIAVWPPSKGEAQYSWGTISSTLRAIHAKGGLKTGRINPEKDSFPFYYLSAGLFEKIDRGDIVITGRGPNDELIVEYAEGLKSAYPRSVWNQVSHDAGSHGTGLLQKIIPSGSFPFPKSLYAVRDSLKLFTAHKKRALILDFFSGSGTTLNSVDLLNSLDGGRRQCIMVTNNEVSEQEARQLKNQGFYPGDDAWEQQGICRAVTWPRSKYTILGKRDNGTELEGDYLTGKTITKEKARTFRRLGFIDPDTLSTAARKKEIVSLIDAIPMSHIKPDTAFFVSEDERHTAAILFDDAQADAFLDALEEMDHITHFYIVTGSARLFRQLKEEIKALLGPIEVQEEEKRPMRDGFPANLAYFKLDFLEKDEVALGRQFRQILPLLWLRAGASGPRPELPADDSLPAMLLPAQNHFAVLLDETRFADFRDAVAKHPDLSHIFLVTDSGDTFRDMAAQLDAPHIIQLYRDYLENFTINQGDAA
jgi:adenine-specific DNA-methyltransferase